jgi:hypothetical protein
MQSSSSRGANGAFFAWEFNREGLAMRIHRAFLGILTLALLSIAAFPVFAEDGVSKDKILFGQVAALTGPAQALGQGMDMSPSKPS